MRKILQNNCLRLKLYQELKRQVMTKELLLIQSSEGHNVDRTSLTHDPRPWNPGLDPRS